MAMIAPMPTPGSASSKDHWEAHGSNHPLSRGDPKPVALPPICQIGRQGRPSSYRHPQSRTPIGPIASEYVHSPSRKRKCITFEEEQETFRSSQVPRFYPRPERPASSHISPHSQQPPTADDTWRSQAPAHYGVPSVSPKLAHRERYSSIHSLPPPLSMESSRDAYYADENAARQRMERQPPAHFSSSISASQPSDYSDRYHPMSADSTQAEVRSSVTPSRYSMAQASPLSHSARQALQLPQPQEPESFVRLPNHAVSLSSRESGQQSGQQAHYSKVSVLLLSWQDDSSARENIQSLQQVFEEDYRYRTQIWEIPNVHNPSIKLAEQMASFLGCARPHELLIIYYSGHGYVGHDGQLYWAYSLQAESAKLKWDGVRCFFEEALSDILLLLDTCFVPNSMTSANGVKQVIAACSPETAQCATAASRAYFSPCLTAALRELSVGNSFSVLDLCHQIKNIPIANVNSETQLLPNTRAPKFFTLTPEKRKDICLSPSTQLFSISATPDSAHTRDTRLRDLPRSPGPERSACRYSRSSPNAEARLFLCVFHFAGCDRTFTNKYHWKRHIESSHLALRYCCSLCGSNKDYSRKESFARHLHRHANSGIPRALAKGNMTIAQNSKWAAFVQQSCLITRGRLPQRLDCPKPGCQNTFADDKCWEEWSYHVGLHIEKGEGENLVVDTLLRQYAIHQGIIKHIGGDQYRLCSTKTI